MTQCRLVRLVTALPDNDLGQACRMEIHKYGVDGSFIKMGSGRMGIYFLEAGANQRPSRVFYDQVSVSEVNQLIGGNQSGRVQR